MKAGRTSRRLLALYWTVVGLFVLILGWWLVFFSQQGGALVERLTREGTELTPEQAVAVRQAADAAVRMLLYEGAFLVLLLLAGVLLTVRSMRQEVLLHRQRRDFLSAVTHELKSPITSARLYVESLILGRVPAEKRAHYLHRTREELDRLAKMADGLLDSARAASGRGEMAAEPLDLAALAKQSVAHFVRDEATPVEIEVDAPQAVQIRGDADALDTILRNLLSNAVKYGGDPPHVQVQVSGHDGRALLAVRDYGPGVQHGSPDGLFGPFVRGDDDLVRQRPGVGLGLYLVAELTHALGGKVKASNATGGKGFAVEVSLPLASAEAT